MNQVQEIERKLFSYNYEKSSEGITEYRKKFTIDGFIVGCKIKIVDCPDNKISIETSTRTDERE